MSRNEVSGKAGQNPLCNARLRQEAVSSKGDSDFAPAMVYCAISQNESKTLLLGIVKSCFHIACLWSVFGIRLVPIENGRSGALNGRS
jgi:hypothetical protein